MIKIISLIICLLALQSCISSYNSGTKEGINVYTSFGFVYALKGKSMEEASKHCAKFNKKAVFIDSTFITSKNKYECK